MANTKISALTAGAPAVGSTDLIPIARSGANVSLLVGDIITLAGTTLAPIASPTFSGVATFAAGSSGNPSVAIGASNIGLWEVSSNTLGMQVGTATFTLNMYSGTSALGQISVTTAGFMILSSQVNGGNVTVEGQITTGSSGSVILKNGNNFTGTTGTQTLVNAIGSFVVASGSANFIGLSVTPTINQTSSASGNYTGILVNSTETAVLGSANRLIDLQVGSTSKFAVDNTGKLFVPSTNTATSATAGSNGAVPAQVAGYLIINVAGANVKLPYFSN